MCMVGYGMQYPYKVIGIPLLQYNLTKNNRNGLDISNSVSIQYCDENSSMFVRRSYCNYAVNGYSTIEKQN